MNTFSSMLGLALLSTLLLASCGPKGLSDETKPMFDEIMVLHDSAMVKMDIINNRREALRKTITKLDEQSSPPDWLTKDQLLDAITALQKADDGMMDWMHEFKHDFTGKTPEETKAYLASEKAKITAVAEAIKASISSADALLEKAKGL